MQLKTVDLVTTGLHLTTTIAIGLTLKQQNSKHLGSYLLEDKQLPWHLLSWSNVPKMFDVSGTMWLATLLFIYGLKSIWIPWLWPVFNQVF
jgi:SSS family solute:Na+ symporter